MRIHLTKSKAGCKKLLESRINKSRIGISQEKNHSGNTDRIIPVTATSTDETPEQNEMWSIFSVYPETLSQCVGRKIKMLRLEAARIDLSDNVELEVKETIAKEERAEKDILVVDNEEEQVIREEVENDVESYMEKVTEKPIVNTRIKSTVSRPDIRDWLSSQARMKTKDKCRKTEEVSSTKQQEMNKSDLRDWLISNKESKEACRSNLPGILVEEKAHIKDEKDQSIKSIEVVEISDEDVASGSRRAELKTTGHKIREGQNPDLRHWLINNTERKEACRSNLPETIEISDEESKVPADIEAVHNRNRHDTILISDDDSVSNRKVGVRQPDIREWVNSQP